MDSKKYNDDNMEMLNNMFWESQRGLSERLEQLSKIAAMTPEQRAEYRAYLLVRAPIGLWPIRHAVRSAIAIRNTPPVVVSLLSAQFLDFVEE